MFQKFTMYRVANFPASADALAQYLQRAEFVPTAATQDKAVGFAPPRGEDHGAFVEAVAGHWFARIMIETRTVPGAAIQKRVDEEAARIKEVTGRKPGRKERRSLKEDALLALLPQAFPKRVAVPLWIDPKAGTLVVGATSNDRCDDVITALVRHVPDLAIAGIQTKLTPRTAMASWLSSDGSREALCELHGLAVERECVLQSADEEKAVIRFTRHSVCTDEVRRHVAEGKLPRRLALEFEGRAAFVLDDCMRVHKLKLLDLAFDGRKDDDDPFDADAAIFAGELSKLIAELIDAMGGEVQQEGVSA